VIQFVQIILFIYLVKIINNLYLIFLYEKSSLIEVGILQCLNQYFLEKENTIIF